MASDIRFVLGKGERLTSEVEVPSGGGPKSHPYTFDEAKSALLPLFDRASSDVQAVRSDACPGGQAVVALTLHPAYLAKSYHPKAMLADVALSPIGSRSRSIVPRSSKTRAAEDAEQQPSEPHPVVTTQVFLAGTRESIVRLPQWLAAARESTPVGIDLLKIEDLYIPKAAERIRIHKARSRELLLEVVLHTGRSKRMHQMVLEGFEAYADEFDLEPAFDRRFETDSLCFVPVRSPRNVIRDLAEFTFLRVVREMPTLRQFRPFIRTVHGMEPFKVDLPKGKAIDESLRVALFDGGLPERHGLETWVDAREVDGLAAPLPEYQRHGMAVTSAFLFGPLDEDSPAERPPCYVHHYRVLDANTGADPQAELYEVLARIDRVLSRSPYTFVGLSIGPDIPVEDDEPSAWTTILDSHFGDGAVFAALAVGNRGEENPDTGYHRIQPPSDCVNAIGVGACDSRGLQWKRASYSCLGPGRCPGLVKPDLVAFGGSRREPYWVLDSLKPGHATAITGTSFSSPTVLRLAALAQAHFGGALSPLAIKALLVHRSENNGHARCEVGWGRIPDRLLTLMTCQNEEVHVIYQDVLTPSRWMRAAIPVPERLIGTVQISATICFATTTDPQDPINYTRSGLEVRFRPNENKRSRPKQVHADTKTFLSPRKVFGSNEYELRVEAAKWETIRRGEIGIRASSLKNPVLDIHYMAREEGRSALNATEIPYALVLSIRSPKTKNLFENTMNRYPVLQQLRPVIEVPIRV